MSGEDISHFQEWPDHDELLVAIEIDKQIERCLDRAKFFHGDVEIPAGGLQARVAHQDLQRPEIRTGFEMMGCESMTKRVHRHLLFDLGFTHGLCTDPLDGRESPGKFPLPGSCPY